MGYKHYKGAGWPFDKRSASQKRRDLIFQSQYDLEDKLENETPDEWNGFLHSVGDHRHRSKPHSGERSGTSPLTIAVGTAGGILGYKALTSIKFWIMAILLMPFFSGFILHKLVWKNDDYQQSFIWGIFSSVIWTIVWFAM